MHSTDRLGCCSGYIRQRGGIHRSRIAADEECNLRSQLRRRPESGCFRHVREHGVCAVPPAHEPRPRVPPECRCSDEEHQHRNQHCSRSQSRPKLRVYAL